jgi:hypothetical protein
MVKDPQPMYNPIIRDMIGKLPVQQVLLILGLQGERPGGRRDDVKAEAMLATASNATATN